MLKIKITHNYCVNLHNSVGANIIIICKYFIIIIIFISHLGNILYNIFYLDFTTDNQINVVYYKIYNYSRFRNPHYYILIKLLYKTQLLLVKI